MNKKSLHLFSSIVYLFLLLLSLEVQGALVDTVLPPINGPMPKPQKNFIVQHSSSRVDTAGMPFRYTVYKGKKIKFKNITAELQKTIQTVIANGGGTVYIPKGYYCIDKTIEINPQHAAAMSITIDGNNSIIAPIYENNKAIVCLKATCWSKPVLHEIRIEKLHFDGIYFVGETQHFFDTRKAPPGMAVNAISVLNYRYIHIANCTFRNLYGQAIYIFNQDLNKNTDTTIRASYAEVYNTMIYNCWGQQFYQTPNGNFDYYGDGILLSSVAKGAVFNNIVYNDINTTGYYGRLGIGTDFQTGNIKIVRNRIHGYDRNIHIENSRGGITVSYNKITGSEMGIFIWPFNTQLTHSNPLIIEYNYISNWGIPHSFKSPRLFSKYSGLINFFSDSYIHRNSIVRNNTIVVDKNVNYGIMTDRNPDQKILLINCKQQNVKFENNKFSVLNVNKNAYISKIEADCKGCEFQNNEIKGVKELNIQYKGINSNKIIK